jgi:predicted Rossmann fold flavoprotein
MSIRKDVIVIGGGAAGLMCAIEAGKRKRSVLLLEHAERLGKKILISGGGRCNFTNLHAGPDNYISTNPDFCKSALARYTPQHFIELVEKHKIKYHEKKLGQLFCDISSRQIVDLLQKEYSEAGVEVKLQCKIESVDKPRNFSIKTNLGDFESESLVIATGGLSFPNLGATSFGYQIAKKFDLSLIEIKPGLVPLVPDKKWLFNELSGISLETSVRCGGKEFRENMLFTHRGLSGPAILQISSYLKENETISIDLFSGKNAQNILHEQHQSTKELSTVLSEHLPRRFAQKWCEKICPSRPMNRFSPSELKKIAESLHHFKFIASGTEGYEKAEVTVGGVDTRQLSSKSMESRKTSGLYFIGEVVDVTGWLGGYNFQWAWSSGFAAGQCV